MAISNKLRKDPDPSYTKARSAALRFISYRSRSENEVKRRLKGRYTEDAIKQALNSLRRHGLVDDISFAKEWRDHRERFRPRGPAVISQELRKLGVDRETIQEALSDFDSAANAYKAGSKYAIRLSVEDGTIFRRKLGGFLQRRGFNGEVLSQAVERIWQELFDSLHSRVDGDSQYN